MYKLKSKCIKRKLTWILLPYELVLILCNAIAFNCNIFMQEK